RPGGANLLAAPAVSSDQIDRRLLDARAVTGGDLEVSLAWNTLTDLDLAVRDPTGAIINAYQPRSASGGVQDVDANPTLVKMEGSARAESGRSPGPENVRPVPEFMIDLDKKLGVTGLPDFGMMSSDGRAAPRFTRSPV